MKPPQSVISSLLLALVAPFAMAAEAPAAFKADPAKGQALAGACGACHLQDGGRGVPANPIIAGQHPEYIFKQLTEFKSGKRASPVMMGMVMTLAGGEADMKHLAAFYASKTPQPGASQNKETLALGEQIYRGGIVSKHVPACSGCHSPNGAGMPAQYPRVAGQHAEYAEAQLLAFRAGTRANSAQMTGIAARMNDREIKAVSDYMAGLR